MRLRRFFPKTGYIVKNVKCGCLKRPPEQDLHPGTLWVCPKCKTAYQLYQFDTKAYGRQATWRTIETTSLASATAAHLKGEVDNDYLQAAIALHKAGVIDD